MHWEKHLPIMYDFWENVLFYTGQYTGNLMQVHRKANVNPINSEHFERWLKLFLALWMNILLERMLTSSKKEPALQKLCNQSLNNKQKKQLESVIFRR